MSLLELTPFQLELEIILIANGRTSLIMLRFVAK